jgi:biotin-dependent carboxylase-like uncharacterized protein
MSLLVIQPGLFSTVQDRGRIGYRAYGVPVGGAFDRSSASLANALAGNPEAEACAVIEMTLSGGRFEAAAPLALALAGAPIEAKIVAREGRETALRLPLSFSLAPGDRLVLGQATRGVRTYLAVQGGWQTPLVLGSRSSETRLNAGDTIPCTSGSSLVRGLDPREDPFRAGGPEPLRLIDGPEAEPAVLAWLVSEGFRVGAKSDRMGLRLEGPRRETPNDSNRISAPVAPGAVQVVGGVPLVLGVACGTMGGYPHVAHVIAADLDRLAQLRPGDEVRFVRIGLMEARAVDRSIRAEASGRRARIFTAVNDRGIEGLRSSQPVD